MGKTKSRGSPVTKAVAKVAWLLPMRQQFVGSVIEDARSRSVPAVGSNVVRWLVELSPQSHRFDPKTIYICPIPHTRAWYAPPRRWTSVARYNTAMQVELNWYEFHKTLPPWLRYSFQLLDFTFFEEMLSILVPFKICWRFIILAFI